MYGNFLIFTVKRWFRLVTLSSDFFGSVEYKSNKDPFIYFFMLGPHQEMNSVSSFTT